MKLEHIQITLIKPSDLVRLDTNVDDLIESISQVGLINPLIVNRANELICGGRRFSALKQLGWEQVPVIRMFSDSVEEELISIDDNIRRFNLRGQELEAALHRRYQLWKQKNPQRKRGGASGAGRGRGSKKTAEPALLQKSFAEDTADKTGKSKRSVQQIMTRQSNASDAVKKARASNAIGASQMDELVKLKPKDQDRLLPLVKDKPYKEIKQIVDQAKSTSLDETISLLKQNKEQIYIFKELKTCSKRLGFLLGRIVDEEMSFRGIDASVLRVDLADVYNKLKVLLNKE